MATQAAAEQGKLQRLIREDSKAYEEVMAAYRLRKTDPEAGEKAIAHATEQAAIIPLQTAQRSLEILRLAGELASIGNPNAITDAGVAGLLAKTAIDGALWNVHINLSDLAPDQAQPLLKKANALAEEAKPLASKCRTLVDKALE